MHYKRGSAAGAERRPHKQGTQTLMLGRLWYSAGAERSKDGTLPERWRRARKLQCGYPEASRGKHPPIRCHLTRCGR